MGTSNWPPPATSSFMHTGNRRNLQLVRGWNSGHDRTLFAVSIDPADLIHYLEMLLRYGGITF